MPSKPLIHFDVKKQTDIEFGVLEPEYGFASFPKAKGIVNKTAAVYVWEDVWSEIPEGAELIFEYGKGVFRLQYDAAKKYARRAPSTKRVWWPLHLADQLDAKGAVIKQGKLVNDLDRIPNTGCPILNLDQLNETVERFMGFSSFVFDIETVGRDGHDGLHWQTNEVIWISIAGPGEAWSIPCGHPTGPRQLTREQVFGALEPLMFSEVRKVNQNLKFDLLSIAKYYGGRWPTGPYGDTLVAAQLLNENMLDKALDKLSQHYLHFSYEKLGKKGVQNYSFKRAALYSYLDAKMTWLLWREFIPRLNDQRLGRVMNLEMAILGVLLDMETEGALIDEKGIHALDERLRYDMEILQSDLDNYNGGPLRLTVPKEKIDFVYKKRGHTPTKFTAKKGEPSTDAEALGVFAATDPAIQFMLDYADVSKLHSTYVAGFIPKLYNGKLHANYRQAGTVTGRFSCSEPNLQNIPRPDDDHAERGMLVRSLFIAPEGHKLVVGDYAQIEMRVIAHYSKDPTLVKNFLAGIDFHTTTASSILGKPIDKVTKSDRQVGKGIAFAVAFGAGPDKVAAVAGVSVNKAEQFLRKHRKEFPNIYTMQADIIQSCKNSRPPHVTTILGRRRRLPTIFANDRSVSGKAERQAVNTVIQGSAADIIKMAMVRLHTAIQDTPYKLILSVHDELALTVPEEDADEAVSLLRGAMEGIDLLSVPLVADIKVVDSWDQAK